MTNKIIPKVKVLKINRDKWLTGECTRYHLESDSCLLSKTGRMCCLGFYMIQAGYKPSTIKGKGAPHEIASTKYRLPELIDGCDNAEETNELIGINDNEEISREVREKRITKGFKSIGVKVRFVGKYPKELDQA